MRKILIVLGIILVALLSFLIVAEKSFSSDTKTAKEKMFRTLVTNPIVKPDKVKIFDKKVKYDNKTYHMALDISDIILTKGAGFTIGAGVVVTDKDGIDITDVTGYYIQYSNDSELIEIIEVENTYINISSIGDTGKTAIKVSLMVGGVEILSTSVDVIIKEK